LNGIADPLAVAATGSLNCCIIGTAIGTETGTAAVIIGIKGIALGSDGGGDVGAEFFIGGSVTRFESSDEDSTPGSESDNDVGGSFDFGDFEDLEDDVVSTGGRTVTGTVTVLVGTGR
jgi:hypothetical protein